MKLYHVTSQERANSIQKDGFKEHGDGWYGLFDGRTGKRKKTPGIFFANSILNGNDGVLHDNPAIFIVEIPESVIVQYEWHEELKGHREWQLPSKIVNKFFTDRKAYSEDEAYEVYDEEVKRVGRQA